MEPRRNHPHMRQASGFAPRPRRAFTITELLVVISIIVLILAIGIPAFSSMSLESRFTQATEIANGVITRANIAALSDRSPTLVRFVPAEWDLDPNSDRTGLQGRQRAITYRYSFEPEDPYNLGTVKFIQTSNGVETFSAETFRREESSQETLFPEDVWVAPAEALVDGPNNTVQVPYGNSRHILNGTFGSADQSFFLDWNQNNAHLDSDDFTIAFDGQTGVKRGPVYGQSAQTVRLWAEDPRSNAPTKQAELRRRAFTGLTFYRREPFVSFGNDTSAQVAKDRQDYLLRAGRPFFVSRVGGTLVRGSAGAQ